MPRLPQLAWNAGEIAPEQQGRVDLAKYAGGANFIINLVPLVAGGLERRPGLEYRGGVKTLTVSPRIEGFIFRDDQSYVIELGDQYIRFWMLGGQIYADTPNFFLTTLAGDRLVTLDAGDALITLQLDPTAAPYEIVSPWLTADLERIQVAQAADVMWLMHTTYEPRTLERSAHSSWTLNPFRPTGGPFMDRNDGATTITPSGVAVGSSITLTASVALFSALHIGSIWRIEEFDTNAYSMWEPAKTYSGSAVVRYGNNIYSTVAGGTSGAVAPVHTEGIRYDGQLATACAWTYLHSGYGVARVTAFTSSTVVTAEVLSLLPSTSATVAWREGAWSDYRGWPRAVVMFQQRLWAAGTATQPQTVWGSTGGDFFDFTPGDLGDDAVTFTLSAKDANPIRTLSEGGGLYIHTSQRTYRVTGTNGGPITPADIIADPISNQGSNGSQAVNADRCVLFVDGSGRELLEIGFDLDADADEARDLTRLANHILRPGG